MTVERDCSNCGEPIASKRLEIKPHARLCVECQEGREDRGEFRKSTMEVYQNLSGWSLEGLSTVIDKGEE